jgi:chromosome segregation ATPase
VTKDDLRNAQKLISDQNTIIRQKNQRINRLVREKSVISAKLASVKQELLAAILRAEAAEKLSTSESLRIELLMRTISRLDDTVNSHQQKNKDLYKSLRATEMREKRAKTALEKVRKELCKKSKWSGVNRRTYTQQYRSLALAFTRAGCAQARLGSLLVRVGKVFGVSIKRSMSRRTVGRVITEAGIKVRLQLGYELARTKGEDFKLVFLYHF